MYSIVLMAALSTSASTPDWLSNCACHGGGGYGACYGGYGGAGYGCYGAGYGCYGTGYGSYGAGYGCYGAGYYGNGGYSCLGCYGGYAGPSPYAPVSMPYGAPAGKVEPIPPPKSENNKESATKRAKLIVELPADAKLFIDDRPMKTTSARRVFVTPSLERDQTYYYILRAEVVRDGKTRSETKRVVFRPGDEIQAAFPELQKETTAPRETRASR